MNDSPVSASMRAAVIDGPGQLTVRTVDLPTPGPGEVLVKVEYCGVCGTDLHSVLEGWAAPGTIGGHEWSGYVTELGPDVSDWKRGDLVVGGPRRCGGCEWCVAGQPSLCVSDPVRSSTSGHAGAFAEFHLAAADSLCRAPLGLDPRAAALAEPLAVALHGLSVARGVGASFAGRTLVSGAGPLGLLVIAALRERGATNVSVSEPGPLRRQQAIVVGATMALAPTDLPAPPDLPTQCLDEGYDLVIETSGRAAAIGAALGLLRPAGRLILLGTGSMSVRLDPIRILFNELVVTGAYCYDASGIDDALALLASGRLPVAALTGADDTSLDELLDTMHRLRAGDLATKVMVRP